MAGHHDMLKIKSLIAKIREVHLASTIISKMIVDGFMSTLLQILCFDDYPCLLYPQYSYSAKIGPQNYTVNAKTDFSIIHQILLVVEDETTSNANRTNRWKKDPIFCIYVHFSFF